MSEIEADAADMLAAALTLVERFCWDVFPANLEDGKKQSHKSAAHSNGAAWGKTRDPDQIRADYNRWPRAGVGVPTGVDNDVFVVETDTKEAHDKDGTASLRALEAEHGPLPVTLMAESPSGSVHRYFRHPGNGLKVKNSASELGAGIDVRGDGGMVVAPPSVRPSRGAYRWLNWGTPIADAPPWLIATVTTEQRKKNTAAVNGPVPEHLRDYVSTGAGTEGIVEEMLMDVGLALRAIPNPDLGWEQWNNMGMATWRSTSGSAEGLVEFTRWSKKSVKHDDAETAARWAHLFRYPPTEVGFGTLAYLAQQADPHWRYPGIEVIDPIEKMPDLHVTLPEMPTASAEPPRPELPRQEEARQEERPPYYDQAYYYGIATRIWGEKTSRTEQFCRFGSVYLNTTTWEFFDHATGETGDRRALMRKAGGVVARGGETSAAKLRWHGEVDPKEELAWTIQDLLPETGVGTITGQWGTYKTFVALDIAASAITGNSFLRFPIRRRGGVLLIAAEGASTIPIRLAAVVEAKCGDAARVPFAWLDSCPRLLDPGATEALIKHAREADERMRSEHGVPLVMVVIDTVAAAAGYEERGDENDSSNSRVIAAMNTLARETKTFVFGVEQ